MLNSEESKVMYEVAKLTNTCKQLTDDFMDTICIFLFTEYIHNLPDGDQFLGNFMDHWENAVLEQKRSELDALTSSGLSMSDMAAGAAIANLEDIDKFKKEVRTIKNILASSIISGE